MLVPDVEPPAVRAPQPGAEGALSKASGKTRFAVCGERPFHVESGASTDSDLIMVRKPDPITRPEQSDEGAA
jgi:hypothetical protein